jgi:hypothetical protein
MFVVNRQLTTDSGENKRRSELNTSPFVAMNTYFFQSARLQIRTFVHYMSSSLSSINMALCGTI